MHISSRRKARFGEVASIAVNKRRGVNTIGRFGLAWPSGHFAFASASRVKAPGREPDPGSAERAGSQPGFFCRGVALRAVVQAVPFTTVSASPARPHLGQGFESPRRRPSNPRVFRVRLRLMSTGSAIMSPPASLPVRPFQARTQSCLTRQTSCLAPPPTPGS